MNESAARMPRLARALTEAGTSVAALIESPEVGASWGRASALEGFTVGGIAGHLVTSIGIVEKLLAKPVEPDAPMVGIVEFYGPSRIEDKVLDNPFARFILDDGEGRAADGQAAVATAFRQVLARLSALLTSTLGDRLITTTRNLGVAPLDQFLATRVVELVVHGDDLAVSVATPWEPPDLATEVALDVLTELARARVGNVAVLRAFARAERSDPGDLRAL